MRGLKGGVCVCVRARVAFLLSCEGLLPQRERATLLLPPVLSIIQKKRT